MYGIEAILQEKYNISNVHWGYDLLLLNWMKMNDMEEENR